MSGVHSRVNNWPITYSTLESLSTDAFLLPVLLRVINKHSCTQDVNLSRTEEAVVWKEPALGSE